MNRWGKFFDHASIFNWVNHDDEAKLARMNLLLCNIVDNDARVVFISIWGQIDSAVASGGSERTPLVPKTIKKI